MKAYSAPVWDGPKNFPAGLAYLFVLLKNSAYGAETDEIVTSLTYAGFLPKAFRPRFMKAMYTYIF